MADAPVVKFSAKVSTLPARTVCGNPVSVSLAVLATEVRGVKPVAVTLTASFKVAPAQALAKVTVMGLGVLVNVQTTFCPTAGVMLPLVPTFEAIATTALVAASTQLKVEL